MMRLLPSLGAAMTMIWVVGFGVGSNITTPAFATSHGSPANVAGAAARKATRAEPGNNLPSRAIRNRPTPSEPVNDLRQPGTKKPAIRNRPTPAEPGNNLRRR